MLSNMFTLTLKPNGFSLSTFLRKHLNKAAVLLSVVEKFIRLFSCAQGQNRAISSYGADYLCARWETIGLDYYIKVPEGK